MTIFDTQVEFLARHPGVAPQELEQLIDGILFRLVCLLLLDQIIFSVVENMFSILETGKGNSKVAKSTRDMLLALVIDLVI